MLSDLPGVGCFEAAYPSAKWSRVACAPAHYNRLNAAPPARFVGNGYDYAIKVPAMSAAIGSFPATENVTSVQSCRLKNGRCVKKYGSDTYSFQLNSSYFTTQAKTCGQPSCQGWEQFLFTNWPKDYSGGGNVTIENFLFPIGSSALTCQNGWSSGSGGCTRYSPRALLVPYMPIANLSQMSLIGRTSSNGDSVILAVGKHMYAVKNAQSDGFTDLSQHWNEAEFNVFGNINGDRAFFNPRATVTVSPEAVTGNSTAPTCAGPKNAGTTGETSNLWFVTPAISPQPARNPSIVFSESNKRGGGAAKCVELAGRSTSVTP